MEPENSTGKSDDAELKLPKDDGVGRSSTVASSLQAALYNLDHDASEMLALLGCPYPDDFRPLPEVGWISTSTTMTCRLIQ